MMVMQWENDGVPFAVDAAGNFRDVSTVARGLQCGCYCADCKGPLVAKKGEIKAHHFAHHDRRECRHALEASLFGMLMTLVRAPGATLMVPPCGERRQLVPRPDEVFTDEQAREFFRTPWVVEAASIPLTGAVFADTDINQSQLNQPEIRVGGLEVHVLSHRKREGQLAEQVQRPGPAVLLLDLRDYAAIWWSVCDEHKSETLAAAMTATGVMTQWLQRDLTGRTWLFHPELEEKKAALRKWIAEKSHVAAQWRLRQKMKWVPQPAGKILAARKFVAPIAPPTAASPLANADCDAPPVPSRAESGEPAPVGYVRRVKNANWLSTHLAAESSLWVDRRNQSYVFLGRPGESVPAVVQEMLDPAEEWRAVSMEEAENFTSAKQLLRQATAPYKLPPAPKDSPRLPDSE
jgi:hypothetical protein